MVGRMHPARIVGTVCTQNWIREIVIPIGSGSVNFHGYLGMGVPIVTADNEA